MGYQIFLPMVLHVLCHNPKYRRTIARRNLNLSSHPQPNCLISTVFYLTACETYLIEQFSIECHKTKTEVIILANQKGRRHSSKTIKTRSNSRRSGDVIRRTGEKNFSAVSHNRARPYFLIQHGRVEVRSRRFYLNVHSITGNVVDTE